MSTTDDREPGAGFELVYTCAPETLSVALARVWTPLSRDAETDAFVAQARARRHGRLRHWLAAALRQSFSDFDVNGWLGLYPMHLLSREHARALLQHLPTRSLLDLGAGNGDVTSCLAPLFDEVQTTEHSTAMVRVLRRRGYACERVSIDDPLPADVPTLQRKFDVVTCFNVIDRTSHPADLLARAAARVSSEGVLVIAVPLPLRPFYYDGPRTLDPEQGIVLEGSTWERQCSSLLAWLAALLPEFGLFRLSRCPYLSGGDPVRSLYVLDDVVVVLRRTGAVANK